ncbi:hypothetical protein A1s21155_00235 [Candidatus Planktophila dulcis]|uniref:Uncharacterized protein n=1 Tax=Candidatus Planktophila dulcis TaxID=1884914 RepID=A0AAC9YS30_9ACTN|nr:hypothetical protein [Candidatus Planktophila dulcis]ASY11452.1 hypothetical protein A1s21155_00235 [Candidatus Planktophila dulcis]
MTPSELEKRLKNLVSKFPNLDITPNTFLQYVKPTEELLEPYSGYFQENEPKILSARLLFFPRIIVNVFKSILISIVRLNEIRSWNAHQVQPKTSLFITHFTNAQQASGYDSFFGELLDRNSDNIFYLNSTRIKHHQLLTFYDVEARKNLSFMTKSLNPGTVILVHLSFFMTSLKLFNYSFDSSLDARDKWLIIEAGVRQHSRPTMANKFFEIRVSELIKRIHPRVIHFTFEGHSHEAVLINLIHREFGDIALAPYQHAPIVPEQFGLMRNIHRLGESDSIFTSGDITQNYFQSFRSDIPITAIGSSKYKDPSSTSHLGDKVKVIGASEGTIQSLEVFIRLFSSLAANQQSFDFLLRVHPAITDRELKTALRNAGGSKSLISHNSLLDDLSTSTYCIYRSSAVAIEGLAYGVTPLYFDQSRSQGLNPLYFANLHLPAFGSAEELVDFFRDVSTLNSTNQGIDPGQLQQISEGYFSKLVGKFPTNS